jgi:hypothetical protein
MVEGAVMNSRSLLVLCTLLFSLNATAQSLNRLEVFGGYQHLGYYTYQGEEGPWSETGYNGFEASAAYRLLPHFSAEADFGFEKGPGPAAFGLGIQTYLGGPRLSVGAKRATFYGHALFGGLRQYYSGAANTTLATALGGGFDLWITRHIGAQLIQADYLHTSTNVGGYTATGNTTHGNYRFSTGIVVRF